MPITALGLKAALRPLILEKYQEAINAAADSPIDEDQAADDIAEAIANALVPYIVNNLTVIAPNGGGPCEVS